MKESNANLIETKLNCLTAEDIQNALEIGAGNFSNFRKRDLLPIAAQWSFLPPFLPFILLAVATSEDKPSSGHRLDKVTTRFKEVGLENYWSQDKKQLVDNLIELLKGKGESNSDSFKYAVCVALTGHEPVIKSKGLFFPSNEPSIFIEAVLKILQGQHTQLSSEFNGLTLKPIKMPEVTNANSNWMQMRPM